MKLIQMIVACDKDDIIGHGEKMPGWHLTDDFKLNFVPKTKGCPVIMGRITAQTLEKPLKGRTNIVISRNAQELNLPEGFLTVESMQAATLLAENSPGEIIWIIGGRQIYQLALDQLPIRKIYISRVKGNFPSRNPNNEVRFPEFIEKGFALVPIESEIYQKRNPTDSDKGNSHDFTIEVWERM